MKAVTDRFLGGRLVVRQPGRGEGYRFNLDPVLLAGFACGGRQVLDLGAGCGIAGLLMLAYGKAEQVVAVEVQVPLADLAAQNALDNGYGQRMEVLTGDLRDLELPRVDRVIFNPPYFRAGQGRAAPNASRDAARHERYGTLSDFIGCAAACLEDDGRLACIVRSERASEAHSLITAGGCGLARRRWVHPRAGAPAQHVLLEAGPRRHCGAPVQEPGLTIHRGAGRAFTPELQALLGEGS